MHELRQKEGSLKLRPEYDICFTLCQALPPEDYDKIMRVTDTSKGTEYQKSKRPLKEKLQQLKDEKQKHSHIVQNNKHRW